MIAQLRAVHIAGAVVAVGLVVLLAYVVFGRGGSEGREPVGPMSVDEAMDTVVPLYRERLESAAQSGEIDPELIDGFLPGLFPSYTSPTGELVSFSDDEIVISVPIYSVDGAYYIGGEERRFPLTEDTLWMRGRDPIDKGEIREGEIVWVMVSQGVVMRVDSSGAYLE